MRTPIEIASSLGQIAELMEIKGENQFKVRAFQVAAEILTAYRFSTEALLEAIKSPGIPKIGANLAARICELAVSESCQELEELQKEIPLSVLELRSVPGIGAKKVKMLWQTLGTDSLDKLEQACLEDKLLDLKGFGEKQQQKILEGIKSLRHYRGWMKQPRAFYLADLFSGMIKQNFKDAGVEVVGQLRRKLEVVNKLELIVSDVSSESLQKLLEGSVDISEASAEKVSILTRRSEAVVFYLFSGSEALRQKFILSGDPSFISWAEKKLGGEIPALNEAEIFAKMNLEFVAPELRETEQQAAWGILPEKELIRLEQIRGIIHCHSTYSDGIDPLRDMAIAARDMGYGYLGIADHSVSARYAGGLTLDKIERQHAEIEKLNQELSPFRVLKGIESDITASGDLDYADNILEKFDFIVASIHSGFQIGRQAMTERVIKAIRNPYTSILGHATGRLLLEREAYEIDLEQVIMAAIEEGVMIEINASPYRLDMDWRWLIKAKELGARFSIDPDSHRIASFSDLQYGVNVARKAGLTKADVVNVLEVEGFLDSFKKK